MEFRAKRKMRGQFELLLLIIVVIASNSQHVDASAGARDTNRLYEDLLHDYKRFVRPVRQSADVVVIQFKFKLLQILDVVRLAFVLRRRGGGAFLA